MMHKKARKVDIESQKHMDIMKNESYNIFIAKYLCALQWEKKYTKVYFNLKQV